MDSIKESNFISCIVYVRNSQMYLKDFLEKTYNVISENFSSYEFVFVNDCSRDDSVNTIKEFFDKKDTKNAITIVNMSKFFGKEMAMAAGIDIAIGDYVFQFDDIEMDFSPQTIMQVYYKCMSGIDIVSAVPKNKRKLTSKLFYYVYNQFQDGHGINLDSETFCIVSRRAINRVNSITKSVPYRKVLYAECGLPIDKVEYEVVNESHEKHSEGAEKKNRFNLALDTLLLFTNIIDKISMILSIFFLAFSLVVGVYVCVVYFGENKPVEGWAPIMGFLSVAFFGIFLVFSVVIKYLSLILNMIFVNENYLVESVEKI